MYQIQPLTRTDIKAAMDLVEAAGWNQTSNDWQRVIDYQPHGCFKAMADDQLVGTVTSTSYGHELAWIGMMLVAPTVRRQGIGRALMERVIDSLNGRVKTIKLDATPVGRPLYEQLGFVAQFDFQRWRRHESTHCSASVESIGAEQLARLRDLDLRAFGVDRWSWLEAMRADSTCLVAADGFGLLRSGRIADYLGPIVATSPLVARQLLVQLVHATSSVVFWDIPRQEDVANSIALEFGFEPVRTLTRMVLGPDSVSADYELQYAICDPATG